MTSPFKPILGIGLAGGAGLSVGGYYLFKSSETKILAEKFRNENITILDYEAATASSANGWNSKLNTYKTTTDNSKIFSDIANLSDDLFNKLKARCKESLEKSFEEIKNTEGLEDKVKRWCTTTK